MSNPRRLDLLYGAHLALVLVLGTGRLLRGLEIAGASSATSFAASASGRAVALVAMVVGVSAIAAVVVGTVLERRNGRTLVLFALLVTAIWSRQRLDALDFAYSIVVVALSVTWFRFERPRSPITVG